MAITKFQFHDRLRGWTLNEMSLTNFNLLVGLSGVGKTRFLIKLDAVRHAAVFRTDKVNGCEWTIELISEGLKYSWSAETSSVPRDLSSRYGKISEKDLPNFLFEQIIRGDGVKLVERAKDKFIFMGKPLPKLKNTESAITLLRDEESIAPLYRAFCRFFYSRITDVLTASFISDNIYNKELRRETCPSLESLRESAEIPFLVKAYILQEDYPREFDLIRNQYIEIFETVSDIRIDVFSKLDPAKSDESSFDEWLTIGVKEKGIQDWVVSYYLSSGMLRTLVHLFELALAPANTVILIDEFEDSLGINCLPQLADHFLGRSRDIQFILTSHHPYVINNIPPAWWKVVTRKGSNVTVKDMESIPALKTKSELDKFILLINLDEYEEGIQ